MPKQGPQTRCRVGKAPPVPLLAPEKLISDTPALVPAEQSGQRVREALMAPAASDGPRWRREQEGLWLLPPPEPELPLLGAGREMLGVLLLRLLLAAALCPGLLGTVPVRNLHLCEGYTGLDGRYHPGFYCPRLTDPPGHCYCCRPGPRALKSCCTQLGLEALARVNLSDLEGPGLLRNPLSLPFVGLYGLLVLLLMALDLLHFCRTRHGRLLPRACRLPWGPRGGRRQSRSRPSRGPGGLPPVPPGRAC